MTRLYYEIIKDIPDTLTELDKKLVLTTGHNLLELAAGTTSVPGAEAASRVKGVNAAVIPITSGEGVIKGFTGAVEAILRHIGVNAVITGKTDVGGFGEAFASGADLVFAADDRQFLAFNMRNRITVDNARATAEGFVQALAAAAEKQSGGLAGREVLVLGLGPVGGHAALKLLDIDARVVVYDIEMAKAAAFADNNSGIRVAAGIEEAMAGIDYVLDATPAAGIISETMIRPNTMISCPGVPLGLTPGAVQKIGPRLIHDNLALGVAVMAVQAVVCNSSYG